MHGHHFFASSMHRLAKQVLRTGFDGHPWPTKGRPTLQATCVRNTTSPCGATLSKGVRWPPLANEGACASWKWVKRHTALFKQKDCLLKSKQNVESLLLICRKTYKEIKIAFSCLRSSVCICKCKQKRCILTIKFTWDLEPITIPL